MYAVIFTSQINLKTNGYEAMARELETLAHKQSGFIRTESARNSQGFGITVSYWKDLAAIAHWKQNVLHRDAQLREKVEWYKSYIIAICKVESPQNAVVLLDLATKRLRVCHRSLVNEDWIVQYYKRNEECFRSTRSPDFFESDQLKDWLFQSTVDF